MKAFLKFALGFVRGSRMAVSFAVGRGGSGLSFCLLIYRDFAYCESQEKKNWESECIGFCAAVSEGRSHSL